MITFNGTVKEWKNNSDGNTHEFSAEEFDGTAVLEFEIADGKPEFIEFDSVFNEDEMQLFVRLETHVEPVMPGKYTIDLRDTDDGNYKFTATAKNARNFSVKFEFTNDDDE